MSEIPVTPASTPFVPTTTPTIELANRLISLQAHPGFLDLIRLSQELAQEAADICADYPGWDAQQIVVLKVRMQVAREHHNALIGKVQMAIQAGLDEMREKANVLPAKTVAEIVDQGDYVREKMLQHFADRDEHDGMRIAGSY